MMEEVLVWLQGNSYVGGSRAPVVNGDIGGWCALGGQQKWWHWHDNGV